MDVAVALAPTIAEELLIAMAPEFYVPVGAARAAVLSVGSFDALDQIGSLKVDFFVLGDGVLDRQQLTAAGVSRCRPTRPPKRG